MPKTDIETLQQLTSFEPLMDYLRDTLGWPIEVDDLDDATFTYTADELGIKPQYAARITSIRQLRPLTDEQVWGIFFVEFGHSRLPVMALRRILQKLVETGRNRPTELPAWKREDLLFICLYTSDAEGKEGQRGITFAHFRQGEGATPELRTFSWDSRETHFYYLRNLNLSALHWPPNDRDAEAWRARWRAAFTVRHQYVIQTAEKLASAMAAQARMIRELVGDLYAAEGVEKGALHKLFAQLQIGLMHDLQEDTFADMIAQTITYGAFSAAVQSGEIELERLPEFIPDTNPFLKDMLRTLTTRGKLDLDELGVGELVHILQAANLTAITQAFGRQTASGKEDPVVHFYELFLSEYDKEQKVKRGVFYTPDPVVEYMVRAVDQILQRPVEEGGFGITGGLASDAVTDKGEPLVQILDPATGTGTFLAHIIDHVADAKNPKRQPSDGWNEYVANSLLRRLHGFELMMAPYTIAHLKLGLKLAQTGYTFGAGERLRVYLTNTLEKPVEMSEALLETDYLSREANEANAVKRRAPIMVVIGNPPYSGHSANDMPEDWIKLNDYYFVDGKPLGERNPKWLQDDYVKFIRFGQWRIEQSGEGILAFISNHSYLDSPTFRGMRQQLVRAFDEIYIVDLHGNTRKRENSPNGEKDENVFDIQQGVAIALFVKRRRTSHNSTQLARVRHRHVWGERESKYTVLTSEAGLPDSQGWLDLEPIPPFLLLVPRTAKIEAEYRCAWSLNVIAGENSLGLLTKRDGLVVGITKADVELQLAGFLDESLSDVEACSLFELSVRDKDMWDARRARASVMPQEVERYVVPELFRPFDYRHVFYHEQFVARLNRRVLRHFDSWNIAIILGRQGGATGSEQWDTVTVTSTILDQNIFRRGGGTVFPLYVYPADDEQFDDREKDWPRTNGRRPNLSRAFVAELAGKLGLTFVTDGRGDLKATFGPEDIFHYAYAVFHSPTYRERYAEQLKIDFPRLPLTNDLALFRSLAGLGADLVALHLLEDDYAAASWAQAGQPAPLAQPITRFVPGANGSTVGPMSKSRAYDAERRRIYLNTTLLNEGSYFDFDESVSSDEAQATWEFQVGGYQVLHKWLYDRRPQGDAPGRTLSDDDLRHYQRVVVALSVTQRLMRDIDTMITAHGGFPLPGSVPEAASEGDPAGEGEGDELMTEPNEQNGWGVKPQNPLWPLEGDQMSFDQMAANHAAEITPPDDVIEISGSEVFTAEDALTSVEGLEVEGTDESLSGQITKPFDPSKIRMNSQQMSLDILIKRMQDGRIKTPPYQREAGIWSDEKKSRLIESILIKIPLPAFYIDQTDDDDWKIIDGLQRLTSLRQFVIEGTLALNGLEFLDANGRQYTDLPRSHQRRIEETQVTVYFVQEGTPPEVTYNIFKRINTGGEVLSAQEIRNALNQGPAIEFLDRLAKSEAFTRATGGSIRSLRRADQEVVLRYIAFAISPEGKPADNDIDRFMNSAMGQLNRMQEAQRNELAKRFERAMNAAWTILGVYSFRKIMPNGRRGQVSRALFDAWCRNFDDLSDENIRRLSQKRPSSRLLARFRELLAKDEAFNKAITASTGDPARVQTRYLTIRHIIHETLGLGD